MSPITKRSKLTNIILIIHLSYRLFLKSYCLLPLRFCTCYYHPISSTRRFMALALGERIPLQSLKHHSLGMNSASNKMQSIKHSRNIIESLQRLRTIRTIRRITKSFLRSLALRPFVQYLNIIYYLVRLNLSRNQSKPES
jgi:hypothetical protein